MLKFTAIKPAPVKSKEASAYLREQFKVEFGKLALAQFDEITQHWTGDRPEWVLVYQANAKQAALIVQPSNSGSKGALKWLWIDKGTKPHVILPVNATVLAFPSSYSAGSTPGSIKTKAATSGGDTVFARGVNHPGTEARGWTEILQKDLQEVVDWFMPDVMEEVANISGHAVK
jgi:hypothetical protein